MSERDGLRGKNVRKKTKLSPIHGLLSAYSGIKRKNSFLA
jgi:hypothetical protein